MNQAFCSNLQYLRKSKKLSQAKLSEAIGVDQCTVSNYEHGATTPPIDIAANIALFFGVSLDWMCGLSPANMEINA